jgi:excisionase family DNA binding protein
MKPTDASELFRQFLADTQDPAAAATLAGLVYQAERQHAEQGLWTTQQVADYLNVSTKTVQRLKEAGKLPVVRIGSDTGVVRFNPEAVRDLCTKYGQLVVDEVGRSYAIGESLLDDI